MMDISISVLGGTELQRLPKTSSHNVALPTQRMLRLSRTCPSTNAVLNTEKKRICLSTQQSESCMQIWLLQQTSESDALQTKEACLWSELDAGRRFDLVQLKKHICEGLHRLLSGQLSAVPLQHLVQCNQCGMAAACYSAKFKDM